MNFHKGTKKIKQRKSFQQMVLDILMKKKIQALYHLSKQVKMDFKSKC